MIHPITRIASLVLAFGLFISCSTLSSTESSSDADLEKLSEKQLRRQIDDLDAKISDGAAPRLLYEKSRLLIELAHRKENPSERTLLYEQVHKTLESGNIAGSSYNDEVNALLNRSWCNEHNEGIKIVQSDSTLNNTNLNNASMHFRNATTIAPDSSRSYKVWAKVYYQNQQPEEAIKVLENARMNIDPLPLSMTEQLAFLYLETNQPARAVETYEEVESFSNENLNLIHGLANAYIAAGNHSKAVELLDMLSENEPDNIIYLQSLNRERYQMAVSLFNETAQDLSDDKSLEETKFQKADSLLLMAKNDYDTLLEENPANLELKKNAALFNYNSAIQYHRLLSQLDKQTKETSERIEEYLLESITIMEQLTGENPGDKQLWKKLYNAYSYMGMDEKAENARSNF